MKNKAVSFRTPHLNNFRFRVVYYIFLRGAIKDSNSTVFTETNKTKEEII